MILERSMMNSQYPLVVILWADASSCSGGSCSREVALEHNLIDIYLTGYYIGRKDKKVYLAMEIVEDYLRNITVIPEDSVKKIWVATKEKNVGLGELDSRVGRYLEEKR
jgi:hypothetical protein